MIPSSDQHPQEQGFVLVDAMVALSVFAVMSAMLFQTVSSTTLTKRQLFESRRAVLIAQSRLAELQDHDSSNALQNTGQEGNFAWRTAVEPTESGATDNSRGLETVRVTVTHSESGRVVVTLKSLRLAR